MITALLTGVFVILYYGYSIYLLRGTRFETRDLAVCGLIAALTVILEVFRLPLPTGATVPLLSPVPILLLSLLYDRRKAIMTGFVVGILVILFVPGWAPVHWAQLFVEHLVCFSCYGYASSFGTENRLQVTCGLILTYILSIYGHTMSGVIFFSQNAWSGWGAWGYSIVYNFTEYIPLFIICTVVVLLMPLKQLRKAVRNENYTTAV
jgi:thiamine transporter